jgi:hypothetical protein
LGKKKKRDGDCWKRIKVRLGDRKRRSTKKNWDVGLREKDWPRGNKGNGEWK